MAEECKDCDAIDVQLFGSFWGNGKCSYCHGSGNTLMPGAKGDCPRCGGSGRCPTCKGKGEV